VPILSDDLFGCSYVLDIVCQMAPFLSLLVSFKSYDISSITNNPQLCLPIYNNDVYTTHYGASVLTGSTFMRFIFSANFLPSPYK
jgi:hypothetical protein